MITKNVRDAIPKNISSHVEVYVIRLNRNKCIYHVKQGSDLIFFLNSSPINGFFNLKIVSQVWVSR